MEYREDYLPEETDLDDLRFLRPKPDEPCNFEVVALQHGWDVSVDEESDENPYQARYVMAREVPRSFTHSDLRRLQDTIGIVDEQGDIYDGHALYLHQLGDELEFDDEFPLTYVTQTNRLIFDFQGFPTGHTMGVLEALLKHSPKPPTRWGRILIYFGMQKLHPGEYTWDFYRKR